MKKPSIGDAPETYIAAACYQPDSAQSQSALQRTVLDFGAADVAAINDQRAAHQPSLFYPETSAASHIAYPAETQGHSQSRAEHERAQPRDHGDERQDDRRGADASFFLFVHSFEITPE